MRRIRKLLKRLFCRKKAYKDKQSAPAPPPPAPAPAPAPAPKLPKLPVDTIVHIIRFVSDRSLWNTLTRMNKTLYHASKCLPAPWPSDQAMFGRDYTSDYYRDDVAFSKDDSSQWLVKVSQKEQNNDDDIYLQFWNARFGPQSFHTIVNWNLLNSRYFGPYWCLSPNLNYFAVYHGKDQEHFIRVYNLISPDTGKPHFDPWRYIDLEQHSPYARLPPLSLPVPFLFSSDGKLLLSRYFTRHLRGSRLESHIHLVFWDLETATCIESKCLRGEYHRRTTDLIFLGNHSVLWTDWKGIAEVDRSICAWNFAKPLDNAHQLKSLGNRLGQPNLLTQKTFSLIQFAQNPVQPSIVAFKGIQQIRVRRRFSNKKDVKHEIHIGIIDLNNWLELTTHQSGIENVHAINGVRTTSIIYTSSPSDHIGISKSTLSWFPDGNHLVFIEELGRSLQLGRVDFSSPVPTMQTPCPRSLPARLVAKANKAINREIRLGDIFCYLCSYKFSPDGRSLVFYLTNTRQSTRWMAANRESFPRRITTTPHVVSI